MEVRTGVVTTKSVWIDDADFWYSVFMLVSHQHRFFFVHVPKTGGASIAAALCPFSHRPENHPINCCLDRLGIHVNHFGKREWKRMRVHASAERLRRVYSPSCYDDYFSFAFVRNPWDRLVSYYHYVTSRDHHHRNRLVAKLPTFADYLDYEARRGKSVQSKLLTDRSGKLLIDFVGRFENIERDFQAICRRIGVSASIPHHNCSTHRDYRTYYDDRTIEMVARHWREDIERFGYTFEGSPSAELPPVCSA